MNGHRLDTVLSTEIRVASVIGYNLRMTFRAKVATNQKSVRQVPVGRSTSLSSYVPRHIWKTFSEGMKMTATYKNKD